MGFPLAFAALGLAVFNTASTSKHGWFAFVLLAVFIAASALGWASWQYLDQFTDEPHIYGPPVPVNISIAWGVKLMTISAVAGAAPSLVALASAVFQRRFRAA